ncbi:MAG: hypothetical protein M1823_004311 [Watsoniomyces obsoletus]|nr:MAG: hypothetical protein M1823_004311 [Watsoniomyces obsoletus]
MQWSELLLRPSTVTAASLLVLYLVAGAIYRLYFSPIAKFPGPKLPALTLWYEFYYDVILRGQLIWKIREWHEQYGPIIRINPYELHIAEPDYYSTVYGGQRDKYEWHARLFGVNHAMFSTIEDERHRKLRAPLSGFFSKPSVERLQPEIRRFIEKLCGRFEEHRESKKPMNLGDAYSALTLDVISEYSFAKAYGCLDRPDFAPEWPTLMMTLSESAHVHKQFGWLFPLMKAMPEWTIRVFNAQLLVVVHFQNSLEKQIREIMDGKNDSYKTAEHKTIFHELLASDLGASDKSMVRLVEEGQTLIAAGTITTAHHLKTITFYLLNNPDLLQRLKKELTDAIPDPKDLPPLQQLERLPFLTAVISEGMRLSYGVVSRLPRVAHEPLKFHEWTIPPKTPISMTSVFTHEDPTLFPEPKRFNPDRWLDQEKGKGKEKYLMNFSKGTRTCLGMNLAYAELYMTLAAIFRRFDLELFETSYEDVKLVHDFFNPCAKLDSKGVRVHVV